MLITDSQDTRLLALVQKANAQRGCLSHLKTLAGRRPYPREDADSGCLLEMDDLFLSDMATVYSSKAFRLQQDKTQVFTRPENKLVRTRITHVMEVVACTAVVSEVLGLNNNLVMAAAAGHDIGHVPFGHQGEAWMAKAMGRPDFCHERMGVITAQFIERRGRGLNLCHQTLEAMMCHSGNTAREGMTQEAWLLRWVDKMAYLFADWNDIYERMEYPVRRELIDLVNSFGRNQRQRTTTAMAGLIIESAECGKVSFEHSELGRRFKRLRDMMYEIYPAVTQQNVSAAMEPVLEAAARLQLGDPFLILALMSDTDIDILSKVSMIDMPAFNRTAVSEIFPYLEDIGPVDLCNPRLDL